MPSASPASILALLLIACVTAPAAAQTTERPVRGQFGRSRATLGASVDLFGGYDVSEWETRGGDQTAAGGDDGGYGGGSVSLAYTRPVSRVSVAFGGSGNLRMYRRGSGIGGRAESASGDARVGMPVGRYGSLQFGQAASISSFYQFSPFDPFDFDTGRDLATRTTDMRVARARTYEYSALSSFSRTLGRFDTLTVEARFHRLWVGDAGPRLTSGGGGARWSRRVSRAASIHAGYGYERGRVGRQRTFSEIHHLDVGGGYAAPLSFSRRTSLSLSGGASVATTRSSVAGAKADYVPQAVGSATLAHELGRTWTLRGTFNRRFQFSEIYENPTYASSASVGLTGLPTRRLTLSLASGYSFADRDAGRGPRGYGAFFGAAATRVALTRALSLSLDYSYYDFTSRGTLGFGSHLPASTRVGRHAVRAGLSWWVPLLTPRP